MTESEFVKRCISPVAKPSAKKVNAGLVEDTSITADKKKKKPGVIELNRGTSGKAGCVTAADAYGPLAGSADGACDAGCDGSCGCGCACGESISPKTFMACLESLSQEYPQSPVVGQIMNMFKSIQNGGSGKLYASADGYEAEDPDEKCMSDADIAISAAAASCAAALETFRAIAGYDYFDYNKGN